MRHEEHLSPVKTSMAFTVTCWLGLDSAPRVVNTSNCLCMVPLGTRAWPVPVPLRQIPPHTEPTGSAGGLNSIWRHKVPTTSKWRTPLKTRMWIWDGAQLISALWEHCTVKSYLGKAGGWCWQIFKGHLAGLRFRRKEGFIYTSAFMVIQNDHFHY